MWNMIWGIRDSGSGDRIAFKSTAAAVAVALYKNKKKNCFFFFLQ